jgi:AcrR family transcriptional regulator
MAKKKLQPGGELLLRVEQAFLDHGYAELSMLGLAKACGFSPRSLYYYFSSKEEAYRAAAHHRNVVAIDAALAAGETVRTGGGGAVDIFAKIMDIRYGELRRRLNLSPHTVELNAETFKRCQDIIIAAAVSFQTKLAQLIVDFQNAGLLRLQGGVAPAQAAQALTDGARGVNQYLPQISSDELFSRYRDMCRFVLYGCALTPA